MYPTIEGHKIEYEGHRDTPPLISPASKSPEAISLNYLMARHCETCVLVYDVGRKASFERAKGYYENFYIERNLERRPCAYRCSPCCPPRQAYRGLFFVFANKTDRPEIEWEVDLQEGQDFCDSIGATFFPTSALKEKGGKTKLDAMTRQILLRRIHYISTNQVDPNGDDWSDSGTRYVKDNKPFWY